MKIKNVIGREILDSRGLPTVECEIVFENGLGVLASVPSGTSVGKYEAVELRDGDSKRFLGRGVLRAIENLEKKISPLLVGKEPNLLSMDKAIIDMDGTDNKSNLGANATLAASMAVAKAQALSENKELFKLVADFIRERPAIPSVMYNVLNGGRHGNNSLLFQEFMIVPKNISSFLNSLEKIVTVYQNLKKLLSQAGLSVNVGAEGGFTPLFAAGEGFLEIEALNFLTKAIDAADLKGEVDICLDVAASQFYDETARLYRFYDKKLKATDMVDLYEELVRSYPIVSIEDGLAEEDWDGWKLLTERLGSQIQLVGDDIFVTNQKRIERGVGNKVANAVLIKPNQIGTVSEALESIKLCKKINYKTVISHRSGETCDTFIADLAVGVCGSQFKCGAPARGERVAKYNRLLRIEDLL